MFRNDEKWDLSFWIALYFRWSLTLRMSGRPRFKSVRQSEWSALGKVRQWLGRKGAKNWTKQLKGCQKLRGPIKINTFHIGNYTKPPNEKFSFGHKKGLGIRHPNGTYLENEYFPRSPVNIELAVPWIVGVDSLSGQEIYNVVLPVLISICGEDLWGKKNYPVSKLVHGRSCKFREKRWKIWV